MPATIKRWFPVVVHLGADQFLNEGSGLAGCISHYARLEDAAANHKYVQSVISWGSTTHDHLGHRFEAPPQNVFPNSYGNTLAESAELLRFMGRNTLADTLMELQALIK